MTTPDASYPHSHPDAHLLVLLLTRCDQVEDATADIRYLEEGTAMKNAPVSQDEIIPAELALIQGIAFDLLCFHPYKTVLALTEDLRTFLKSDKGKSLVTLQDRPINGQDLKPFYDQARTILEEALLRTDVALLYTPGQLGLASLMAAQDSLQAKEVALAPPPLQIDWQGYVRHRFEADTDRKDSTWQALQELRQTLRQPPADFDVVALKAIHKKLKKVRAWGGSDASSSKKRKKEEAADRPAGGSQKKAKIE
jgi:cyclin H